MKRLTPLAALFVLAACAATGPVAYGPADDKGFGYSETKIESDRYRISFAGSAGMSAGDVEVFALRRAADLATADGYDWFRLVSRQVSAEERGGVALGGGVGSGSYGRNTGVGVSVGGSFGKVGAKTFYTARLEVLLGKGEKPDGPDYYDATGLSTPAP